MCYFEAAIYNYVKAMDFECDEQTKKAINKAMVTA
jgi:hypothetical protein